jgi:DNA (cytosine-5)-methyltransferase 1
MTNKIKFIDLFAGIGGFHKAFHDLGGVCVFASEIDKFARKTYETNFTAISPDLFKCNNFNDDILKLDIENMPDFDLLCAGFPCQPFSQAGYKKGFEETKDSRGNMFFIISDIIRAKRPKAIFLENVRHLIKHDDGRTFATIKDIIENELGYHFYWKVVKASDYGLPQHRPRVYMIGIDKKLNLKGKFVFPDKKPLKYTISDIFAGKCAKDIGFTLRVGGRGSNIEDRRNWEFYLVDNQVKRLGVEEGKKMMGLPEDFIFPVSEVQAMKQLGNSVAVDAIREVGKALIGYAFETNNYPVFKLDNNSLSFVVENYNVA